ncbi:hypothetical protein [Endozoicomonas sp. SESOKO1]|uniref:hypothetical protein n=1 Tax=Endozoicomonas sp. SESOKO1 TaxID=2828742 RepID=UPI002149016D|nr:hypothetical protein [Endozoicomonas sp. SESOKO1]
MVTELAGCDIEEVASETAEPGNSEVVSVGDEAGARTSRELDSVAVGVAELVNCEIVESDDEVDDEIIVLSRCELNSTDDGVAELVNSEIVGADEEAIELAS